MNSTVSIIKLYCRLTCCVVHVVLQFAVPATSSVVGLNTSNCLTVPCLERQVAALMRHSARRYMNPATLYKENKLC
jgi:hypothetical protein